MREWATTAALLLVVVIFAAFMLISIIAGAVLATGGPGASMLDGTVDLSADPDAESGYYCADHQMNTCP